MEEEESENYEKVKEAILWTYKLVPEAYRQKFRNSKKGWNQTYTEFAYEKGVLLDRWCAAELVEEDFWCLRELILIEEFKGCVLDDIRMYLNEKPNKSISKFARFADEYALTHKTKFSLNKSYQRDRGNGRESPPSEAEIQPGARGKIKEEERQDGRRGPGLTCFNCGKVGHIASKCLAPRKETGKWKAAVPKGCVVVISKSMREPQVDRVLEGSEKCISEGTVSVREGDSPVPVRIWRDTGAELSLISSKVLDFGRKTGGVALRGIGKGTEAVPLHRIIINCELVSGPVEIEVQSEFPRTDVDILLSNDLAGGEVWSAMELPSQPVSVEDPPLDSKTYPACTITRSMSRKAAENETSLNPASIDLAEMFLPTLYQAELEGGKTENRKVKESKREDVDLPLARRKFIEARSKDEKQIRLLKGPGLDMDDLSGLAELFEEVENSKSVPDNEMRAVLDEKDATTLKKSAGLADEVVSAREVEFTPEGSCPESNWEDQGNLEFEPGTGIESLEEADVPFECVQDVDARGTEPNNGAQKKSEVFDSVEKECSPCGSDGLGSVKKGLTLVIVGSENSQLFVLEGVLNVSEEMKGGEVNIIIEGKGKSVVPKLNEENLKSVLVSEAVTRLQRQWLGNTMPATQLQVDLECKGAPHAIVIQECALKRQNLKWCLDKEGSLAEFKLKTHANNLLKIKELCGNSENGLSLEHIVDKITPMKGACKGLFHTSIQVNHVGVNWKRGEG
ncbi:uncharacterized protein LOC132391542 [Hypanus sabinus]|uniref:uncharacterized protein LOC132391542 n=1 Tax=Hypanus sabinus TaxID=79690 RepID=UPI0028C39B4C|nr:uncharacterized protein LOC132391542 [Hypanus sabinus]XP_059820847.1 uncharacterized protein LOC132391542 [Hypanus sabinus]XP_059820848.1 uncharacterized protein LOC132391542 [Hypanus sabinus]XP_059820849.1 uncharacterized protein LOC132391542 [Hypanus sabinus]XP_059820850.1 uncharacterized protein LOC132391542 [Hypanus sabinus]